MDIFGTSGFWLDWGITAGARRGESAQELFGFSAELLVDVRCKSVGHLLDLGHKTPIRNTHTHKYPAFYSAPGLTRIPLEIPGGYG